MIYLNYINTAGWYPKKVLSKKHLKGSGAAESHYGCSGSLSRPWISNLPTRPFRKDFRRLQHFQGSKIRNDSLYGFEVEFFENTSKWKNVAWELFFCQFGRFPEVSLFLSSTGTFYGRFRDLAHQFAAEDPEFVLLLVVKEFESTKQRLLLPFQLLTKSSWKGSWGERLRALVVVKSISWQFLSSSFNCYLSPPPYCNLFAPLIQPAIHLPTFKHLNCLDLHVPTSAFPPCSFHEFSHLPNAKPQAFLHFQKFKSVSPFPIVPKDRPHPVARGGRAFKSLQVYTTILRNLCWCHPSYRKTHIYIQLRNAETYDKYIYVCEIHDKYIWISTWPRHFETGKSMFNPLQPYEGEKIQLQRWK